MEEWKTYKLEDLCKRICSGGTPKSTCEEFYGGTIPWLNTKEVNFNRIYETESTITQTGYNNSSAKWVDANSIIVAMYGNTAGKVALAKIPLTTNQACCNLTIDELKADYRYLFYYLLSQYDIIKSKANGAAQQNLNAQQIKDLLIPLPSLETQRVISDILTALDDKIELNNRINHNLEEQAQALYKSWFVDFEPFKDGKFVESELGMIPEGWRVLPAESICPINIGKTPPRSEHTWFSSDKQNITWVSISDMGNAGCFINSSAETLTKEAVEKFNIKVVPQGSILLSFKLTIGRVAIAGKELTSNEAIARFEASDYQRSFLFLTLKSYDYSSLGSTSSIATAVNSKIIKSMPIICPTDKIMTDFHFLTNDIFTEIQIRQEETSRLSELRDSLLPKLMSGELKINEIDC